VPVPSAAGELLHAASMVGIDPSTQPKVAATTLVLKMPPPDETLKRSLDLNINKGLKRCMHIYEVTVKHTRVK